MDNIIIEKAFTDYYRESFDIGVPLVVLICFILVLCLSFIAFLIRKGLHRGVILTIRVLLFEFLIILYCATVVSRKASDFYKYNFHPFWSYKAIAQGHSVLLAENFMNVLVFIPVGLMMDLGFHGLSFVKIIGFGTLFSISVEFMQLVFKRGFCEIDDVIHNTLGCMIGYGMYLIASMCIRKINNLIGF